MTVFVAPLITETESLPSFATYTVFVIASTVTPWGSPPTGIVALTLFVAPSITDTVKSPRLVT